MNNYCRLCLKSSREFTRVYDKIDDTSIARLIQEMFRVSILHKDEFSKVVCKTCTDIIVDMVNHRKKFLRNAMKLIQEGEPEDTGEGEEEEVQGTYIEEPETKRIKLDEDNIDDKKTEIKILEDEGEVEFEAVEVVEAVEVIEAVEVQPITKSETETESDAVKKFGCLTCNKRFIKSCHLRDHQFREHNHSSFKLLYECATCNNSFMTKKTLAYHEKIHEIDLTADKVFENGDVDKERTCSKCHLKFKALDRLRQHYSFKHEKEKKKK